MKKKMSLEELKIQSFVTDGKAEDTHTLKGGATQGNCTNKFGCWTIRLDCYTINAEYCA